MNTKELFAFSASFKASEGGKFQHFRPQSIKLCHFFPMIAAYLENNAYLCSGIVKDKSIPN